jgi:hypothetical protein
MQSKFKIFAALIALVMIASPAAADNGDMYLGGNLGYFALQGDDFEAAEAGFGVNGLVRRELANDWSLSGIAQWNKHGIDGSSDDVSVLAFGAEPRHSFTTSNPMMRPYLGARGAWLRQSSSSAGIDSKASGWAFGLVGGINWQVNPKVAIETGLNWNAISFGDVEVDGTSVNGTDSSGKGLAFTTGIVVGLGQ